jgi:hypothetical protein
LKAFRLAEPERQKPVTRVTEAEQSDEEVVLSEDDERFPPGNRSKGHKTVFVKASGDPEEVLGRPQAEKDPNPNKKEKGLLVGPEEPTVRPVTAHFALAAQKVARVGEMGRRGLQSSDWQAQVAIHEEQERVQRLLEEAERTLQGNTFKVARQESSLFSEALGPPIEERKIKPLRRMKRGGS